MRYHFPHVGKMVVGAYAVLVVGSVHKSTRKDGRHVTIEVSAAIVVSVISLIFTVIMGLKNNKRTDTKDVEERVKENTRINMKLDNINSTTQEIKSELMSVRTDLQKHNDKIIILEQSCKQAHKRIDEMVSRLNIDEKREDRE